MSEGWARRRTSPKKVGDVLGDVLRGSGLARGLERAAVIMDWPEAVGERIAAVARARSFSEGTLFVEVRSSAWMMELEMMKRDLLERLNQGRQGNPIDRVVFVLAESPEWGPVVGPENSNA